MRLFLVVAIFLTLTGCKLPAIIVGEHEIKSGWGLSEKIRLNSDSTYLYERTYHLLYEISIGRWKAQRNLIVLFPDSAFTSNRVFLGTEIVNTDSMVISIYPINFGREIPCTVRVFHPGGSSEIIFNKRAFAYLTKVRINGIEVNRLGKSYIIDTVPAGFNSYNIYVDASELVISDLRGKRKAQFRNGKLRFKQR